jgi:tRNA pseudouridine-54 N-methylase
VEGGVIPVHVLLGRHKTWVIASFLSSALLISHGVRRDMEAVFQSGSRVVVVKGSKVRHLRPDQDSGEGYVRAVERGKAEQLGAEIREEYTVETPCLNITQFDGKDIFTIDLSQYKSFVYGERLEYCDTGYLGAEVPVNLMPAAVNIILDRIRASRD